MDRSMFDIIRLSDTMAFTKTPNSYGIADITTKKYLFRGKGNTERLKNHYLYYLCQHKQNKHYCMFIDPIVNIPYYLPLEKL